MTSVLVTGCGGFLGKEIVHQLLRQNKKVVGISRGKYPDLESHGMIHRQGDLTDAAWTVQHVKDVDAVIHCAAIAGVWGDRTEYEAINYRASQNVLAACQKNEIQLLIHTSSPSVTFDGSDQSGIDENVPYPDQWLCDYPRTKALAERAILDAHGDSIQTCALRPHLIWGDGDPHLLPRVIGRAKSGRLRIVGDGTNQVDTVHVSNAAHAHLCALDALRQRPDQAGGRAYFITQDEPVNCWDWIRRLCEIAGVEAPQKRISHSAAYRLGAALEFAYRVLGLSSEPPMTRFVASQLAKDHYFDISAAKQRLGYQPIITMEQGLTDTEEFLRGLGK